MNGNQTQASTPSFNEYITDTQLCELVRVDPRTTQRWRTTEQGPPFVRVGARRILYRRSDVEAWLLARTHRHRAAELAQQAA